MRSPLPGQPGRLDCRRRRGLRRHGGAGRRRQRMRARPARARCRGIAAQAWPVHDVAAGLRRHHCRRCRRAGPARRLPGIFVMGASGRPRCMPSAWVDQPRWPGCSVRFWGRDAGRDGFGITVEAEHAHVGPCVQQQGRVACATDRAVDDQPGGHRKEQFHHLPRHHREMRELLLQCRLLAALPEPRRRRSRLQPPGRQAPPGMSPRVGYG